MPRMPRQDRKNLPRRLTAARAAVVTVAFGLAAAPAGAESLKPFDEALHQQDFQAWRTRLIGAVRRNDVDAIVAAAAPRIQVSFGTENGRKAFREMLVGSENIYGKGWKLEARRYRRDLLRVLRLGGGFVRDRQGRLTFVAPYTEAHSWRISDRQRRGLKVKGAWTKWEGSELGFVTRGRVPLLKYPNAFAKRIALLDHEIVRLGSEVINRPLSHNRTQTIWRSIRLPGGKLGWIESRYIHAAFDHRAYFRKTGGTWQMMSFVAGD